MIRVSVVLLVGLVATAALRKQSAALRHCVLASAIACAAVMPVLQLVAPTWQLPVPAFLTSQSGNASAGAGSGSVEWLVDDSAVQTQKDATGSTSAGLPWLKQIWLAGIASSLFGLLAGFGRLAWLTRRSERVVDGTWFDLIRSLSVRWSAGARVRLLKSDHPALLVTWGLRNPKVILPRAAGDWPADRIVAVLGHELAHVTRRDWAVQVAAELLRCIYWFNPLIWIACRRLRQESEKACDDAVLGTGMSPADYAAHLLDVARAFRHTPPRRSLFPAPAMARPSHLERRVRVMLKSGSNHAPLTRLAGIAVAVGLLAVTVPIAGLVAASETSQPAASQPNIAATGRSAVGDRFLLAPSTPAFVAAGSRAPGQAASAEYSVTVTDQTGRHVFGAVARISGGPGGLRIEMKTGEEGNFSATGLPAGEYQLEVMKPGFMTIRKQVVLAAGQQLREELVAQIGSLSEMIVVQGGVPATRPAAPPMARQVGRPAAAMADPCANVTTGGCITPPMKLLDVKPVFPPSHASDGAAGTVVIEGRVGTDGFVKDMKIKDTADAAFAESALNAVRQWEFSPVKLNGTPVECRIEVTVKFVAGGN